MTGTLSVSGQILFKFGLDYEEGGYDESHILLLETGGDPYALTRDEVRTLRDALTAVLEAETEARRHLDAVGAAEAVEQ